VTAGQVSESTRFESIVGQAVACLIGRRGKRRRKPRKLAADKGYSAGYIRDWLKERRIKPVIPHKDNEAARWDGRVKFDRDAYRGRCVVEQCVGWLKEYRRIGTRFEKLAVHYHGMLQLAMIRRYLKMLFSDRA
jgi:transposase